LISRSDRPSAGLVGLKVDRPHVVLRRRGDRSPIGAVADARPLALAARHAQALLAPHALHTLAIDLPALGDQVLVRAAVPPPLALRGERPQRRAQRLIVARHDRLAALRETVLPVTRHASAR
jgi:hypothetical protein